MRDTYTSQNQDPDTSRLGVPDHSNFIDTVRAPKVEKNYVLVTPNQIDPDLRPSLDPKSGTIIYEVIPFAEKARIPQRFQDRCDMQEKSFDQSTGRQEGVYICYKNRKGELIPELRQVPKRLHELTAAKVALQRRIVSTLNDSALRGPGVLARGSDAAAVSRMVNLQPFVGRAISTAMLTVHSNEDDPFGEAYFHGITPAPENHQGYVRVAIHNALHNGNDKDDLIIDPVRPGTKLDDRAFFIHMDEIDKRSVPFDSSATRVMTRAVMAGESKGWTGQTMPFGKIGSTPWAGTKNYPWSIISGMKALEIDGGVYIFRADKHIQRFMNNLEALEFPKTQEGMLFDMLRDHFRGDRVWVPCARKNVRDPNNMKLFGAGMSYYGRLNAYSDQETPRLVKPYSVIEMAGCPRGDYKGVDTEMLQTILLGKRPVEDRMAWVKAGQNYAGPVGYFLPYAKKGYHEALFTRSVADDKDARGLQEGTGANYFVIHEEENGRPTLLHPNPKLQRDILDGITSQSVMELARSKGWNVISREVTTHDLAGATEVMVTGTAMEVRGVNRIDMGSLDSLSDAAKKGDVSGTVFDRHEEKKMGKRTAEIARDLWAIQRREHSDPYFNDWMQRVA